jgi:hypothetical protein
VVNTRSAPLTNPQFLDNFYNELNISNFKDKIKSEADAIMYCQLTGISPTRLSIGPNCPVHQNMDQSPITLFLTYLFINSLIH